MTKEEKQILIADLCARFPYGLVVECIFAEMDCDTGKIKFETEKKTLSMDDLDWLLHGAAEIKPYLRPMSDMTEEEKRMFRRFGEFEVSLEFEMEEIIEVLDMFNRNHLDYRGMIEKGLALEAPNGMYNVK